MIIYQTRKFTFIKYLDVLDKYLDEYSTDFLKQSDDNLKNHADEDKEFELEFNILPEYSLLAEEFPDILRKSFIITCYSYLEHGIKGHCNFIKIRKSEPLDITDLGKGGIDQAKTYLKKVANIDISDTKSWNDIKHIGQIRNRIVHQDSSLPDEGSDIRKYINSRPQDFSINGNKFIIHAEYCRYVINTIDDFLFSVEKLIGIEEYGNEQKYFIMSI